jgi:hypothetical protein
MRAACDNYRRCADPWSLYCPQKAVSRLVWRAEESLSIMETMPANDSKNDDSLWLLERAVEQALDLRQTVAELPDQGLRLVVDVVLIELGRQIAAQRR